MVRMDTIYSVSGSAYCVTAIKREGFLLYAIANVDTKQIMATFNCREIALTQFDRFIGGK